MQSSAIQFVIGMEIERQKRGRKKKTVLHLVLLVGLPVCKPAYVYLHVDACRARVCVCVYVLSVPFQYSPGKSGLYTQSNLDLRLDLFYAESCNFYLLLNQPCYL